MSNKAPQYQQFLDQRAIIATSCKYPQDIQEAFVWLASYLRDECSGNLDILMPQIRNLGFATTAGTIAKVLIGRWNQDSNGNVVTPIISKPNFLQIVSRLSKQARANKVMGKVPFIKTSAWRLVEAYIEERRAKDAVCKMGIILGPTGSQKGACGKHFCIENNHGTSRYIEAPDRPSLRDFITAATLAFGGKLRWSFNEKKIFLKESINETNVIYIANVQRLYTPGGSWYQGIFNWLQEMQEVTNSTVILEAVLEFQRDLEVGAERNYFEQFQGRCGGDFLILPQYPPAEDLYAIGAAFGLGEDKKTLKLLDEIVHQRGRIRRLFHILQKAKRLASSQNETMTLDHVEEIFRDMPINVPLIDATPSTLDAESRDNAPSHSHRRSETSQLITA